MILSGPLGIGRLGTEMRAGPPARFARATAPSSIPSVCAAGSVNPIAWRYWRKVSPTGFPRRTYSMYRWARTCGAGGTRRGVVMAFLGTGPAAHRCRGFEKVEYPLSHGLSREDFP